MNKILLEGGNVWPDVTPFDHLHIPAILKTVNGALKGTNIRAIPVGSAATPTPGKISGDLDVVVDETAVQTFFNVTDGKQARKALAEYLSNKGFDISQSGINVHIKVPVGTEFHQVDVMVTANARKVALFHTHTIPKGSPYKGVNKQLIMAMIAKERGLMWSAWQGLFNRDAKGKKGEFVTDDLNKVAHLLLGADKTAKDLGSVEAILAAIPPANAEALITRAKEDPNWAVVKENSNKLFVKKLSSEQELIEHAKLFAKALTLDGVPISSRNRHTVVCSTIFARSRSPIRESRHLSGGRQVLQMIQGLDEFGKLNVQVGSLVSIINAQLQGDSIELWGFVEPKTVSKISRASDDNSIKQFEFNNDPNDVWPRTEHAEFEGQFLMYSAFFGSKQSAEHAVSMILLQASGDLHIRNHIREDKEQVVTTKLKETSGNSRFKRKQSMLEASGVDSVTLDVPLLIRIMEYAKEDAKTDMDLHKVAERLIKMGQSGETLSMDQYDEIVGAKKSAPAAPAKAATPADGKKYWWVIVEYGPHQAHELRVAAATKQEAHKKAKAWADKNRVQSPMISVQGEYNPARGEPSYSVDEGKERVVEPITAAAKEYHDKHEWILNGNIPGAFKRHYEMIAKLNKQGDEGNLREFAADPAGGGDDDGAFNPGLAKMAHEEGFVKGASLGDGSTLEYSLKLTTWDTIDGGLYAQYFATGFKKGRMDKINFNNKQYNLNLQLQKDGSIVHGPEDSAVDEGSKMNRFARKYIPGATDRQVDSKIKDQQATQLLARDGDPSDPLNQKDIKQTTRNIQRLKKVNVNEAGSKKVKQRLDPKCWDGYKKAGTKVKDGTRVNNCVPKKD